MAGSDPKVSGRRQSVTGARLARCRMGLGAHAGVEKVEAKMSIAGAGISTPSRAEQTEPEPAFRLSGIGPRGGVILAAVHRFASYPSPSPLGTMHDYQKMGTDDDCGGPFALTSVTNDLDDVVRSIGRPQ